MADEVRSSSPVNALGNFPGRAPDKPPSRSPGREAVTQPRAADRVTVGGAVTHALRLLRERVLAKTRVLLALGEGHQEPEFAEVMEGEPVPAFLGRLLSAQNQLAGRRAGAWPADVVRQCCADALAAGVQETLDLLAGEDEAHAMAVAVVAEVLAEYGRRLSALASSAEPHPTEPHPANESAGDPPDAT